MADEHAVEVVEAEPVDALVVDDGGAHNDLADEASATRTAVALLFPVLGAAVMAGGVFTGVPPRIYAAVGGILGMVLALFVVRLKRPLLANVCIAVGLFAIGLVLVGPGNVADAGTLAQEAAKEGDLTRPPIEFTAGWKAITGWLMGIVGFATAWVGVTLAKRAMALLVPLPFAAIAGISVPDSQQVASGIVVLVLFAVGLGMLGSINSFEGSERPPLSYELRKVAKSLPVIGVITVALIALSQTSFLFPAPQIDPAEEPQKPKSIPPDDVEDRVLFEVGPDTDQGDTELKTSGPWRMGTLTVYDGRDWRLPAVSTAEFEEIPSSGIIDEELIGRLGVRARFKLLGLGGTVLPGLPNSAAIITRGVDLAYDANTGNVRVASGQVRSGQVYRVAAAGLPEVDELRALGDQLDLPPDLLALSEIPAPPPAVQALLDEASATYDNAWDRFFFLFDHVNQNVVASGPGTPASIPPERVQEILGGTLEASPFEIVAMQAMLARWVGLPARIGYGFDGGDRKGAVIEVRPKHGASFPEVHFPGFGWLPVIGKPSTVKPTVGTDPGQQEQVLGAEPSSDTVVQLYLPALLPPASTFTKQVQLGLAVVAAVGLLVFLVFLIAPVVRKAVLRSRRRSAARREGPRARVALAYAEWRDHAADYGFAQPTDTPLMYLDRFVEDPEHTELAWLTTRCLWGDLRGACDDETAGAAEELARALRQRLSRAQPATMRFVAAVSRISLKHPFAPATDLTSEPTDGPRRFRRRADAPDDLESAVEALIVAPPVRDEEDARVPSPL